MSATVELTDEQAKRLADLRERQRRLNIESRHADEILASAERRAMAVIHECNACFDEIKQIESGLVTIPRAYLDALEALLAEGSCIGVSDGRWAAEHVWQNAENERDAAREEMGL